MQSERDVTKTLSRSQLQVTFQRIHSKNYCPPFLNFPLWLGANPRVQRPILPRELLIFFPRELLIFFFRRFDHLS